MPSLKDIRRRIQSVKNTQKITRAMKLVAAAKFARANQAVVAARPYGTAFDAMVSRLVAAAGDELDSPLVTERPEQNVLVILLATDRGFCGGLNSNLFKATLPFIEAKRKEGKKVDVAPWGKRSRLFITKFPNYKQVGIREKILDKPSYTQAQALAAEIAEKYEAGEYDRIYISYVEFRSAMSQTPRVKQLLPIPKPKGVDPKEASAASLLITEPALKDMLPGLLRRSIASNLFRTMLEGAASEHGARMTAMDSATNNAKEVLRAKQIQYNRARQAAITKELIEITSGAQAV